jgi:hypothetical protein
MGYQVVGLIHEMFTDDFLSVNICDLCGYIRMIALAGVPIMALAAQPRECLREAADQDMPCQVEGKTVLLVT